MESRKFFATVTGSGLALGLLVGLTTNTSMLPPKEPTWKRLAAQDIPSSAADFQFIDSGPQDLSPNWYMDRMPTWKRRQMELEMRPYYLSVADTGYREEPIDYPEPVAEPPAPEPRFARMTPLDQAAEERDAAQAAAAPADPLPQPAAAPDDAAAEAAAL